MNSRPHLARHAARVLSILSGIAVADWVSHHDASWFGYGVSTPANGGDPLALAAGLVVAAVCWWASGRVWH